MNEQTTKLIEQLAQKLGTTADYLWSVLIKQASVSAITDLIYFALTIISGFILYKMHKYFSFEKNGKNSIYCEMEELIGIPMAIISIIWAIIFIVCFFSIGNIINGLFNPEYWALEKVLSSINQ